MGTWTSPPMSRWKRVWCKQGLTMGEKYSKKKFLGTLGNNPGHYHALFLQPRGGGIFSNVL